MSTTTTMIAPDLATTTTAADIFPEGHDAHFAGLDFEWQATWNGWTARGAQVDVMASGSRTRTVADYRPASDALAEALPMDTSAQIEAARASILATTARLEAPAAAPLSWGVQTPEHLAQIVSEVAFRDWTVVTGASGDDFTVQWTFLERDNMRPEDTTLHTQRGRVWLIARGSDTSSVCKTLFLAAQQALLHEFQEQFTVNGKPLLDPHAPVV